MRRYFFSQSAVVAVVIHEVAVVIDLIGLMSTRIANAHLLEMFGGDCKFS